MMQKERRWLEVLLAEVTYVSPVQQDPLAIQSAAVFHTNKEEYREYRWLCDDLGRLLQDVHAKDEWASRNTYSGLLELTQRAEQLGSLKLSVSTSYVVLRTNICSWCMS